MDNAGRNASVDSLLSVDERTPFTTTSNVEPDSHHNLIVLVPDDEDDIDTPFYFSDGDDEGEYDPAQLDWLASSATPLLTSRVYLYLVSPFLGLGAMFIPDGNVPRPRMVAAICVFLVLSTFARYIWYLLARYLRKIHLEDIVADAFAKGHTKERLRARLRTVVRVGDWISKVLLATIYLRVSVSLVLPLMPEGDLVSSRFFWTTVLLLGVLPLSTVSTLASKRAVVPTILSIITYVAWFACTAHSHGQGSLEASASWTSLGSLWDGISPAAFTFTASSTVSLYSSLKAGHLNHKHKTKAYQSFRTLLILSGITSLALILPLAFFNSSPKFPAQDDAKRFPRPLRAVLHASTLMLTVPQILVNIPTIPLPFRSRHVTNASISHLVSAVVIFTLAVGTPEFFHVLSNVALVYILAGTYVLPAAIHITLHHIRRPLTIILPPQTQPTRSFTEPDSAMHDPLLQRKERLLQRRRLYRRLVWDIGAWILLIPFGGGCLVWAGGRLAGKW
ncbi:hypothetical protein BJ322DRAFT_1015606 [Thelephora terrestris]|uniref:Uncharacterized protein n=1 Tax=Thelephora terrestris TaxID=56493 RepID=A0A9P6H376_9AGAM|nr:hypothetical protein BJ322DRAFT_1015606 [Thelephora terrestris]